MEQEAVMGGMDTLNEASTGSAGGSFDPIGRAQGAAGVEPTGGAISGSGGSDFSQFGADLAGAAAGAAAAIGPRITVVAGTRVFDAITGELLDDAVERQVPQSQRDQYYDDGTHGDLQADDGKYTRVGERRDRISHINQRIKEQLIKSLVYAADLNPLEFYGYTLMSTERYATEIQDSMWRMVPDPRVAPVSCSRRSRSKTPSKSLNTARSSPRRMNASRATGPIASSRNTAWTRKA